MEYIEKMTAAGKRKRYRSARLSGSAVIEMSFIIPLFLGLFVLIVHTVFYCHDKAVLNAAAAETAVLGAQAVRREGTEYDLEDFFMERSKGNLIYMTGVSVSVSETEKEVTVEASARRSVMALSVCQKARIVRPEEKLRMTAGQGWDK